LAIARFLKATAPALHRRRGGRMVRQQQPDAIRLEYFKAIMPHIQHQIAQFGWVRTDILQLLVEERRERGDSRMDDIERKRRSEDLIKRGAIAMVNAFRPTALYDIAEQFGKRTSQFSHQQLDRQVRQALGVPLMSVEKPIRDLLPGFATDNVALIKTVGERYHERISKDVQEAFDSGVHPETLAQRFVELDDIAESDARRIARDQIGKLNADFNQERQESLGITGYIWRTSNDERVRNEHADREGEHFEWDDPPEDGAPGEAVMCRCFAEPDLSPIIADL